MTPHSSEHTKRNPLLFLRQAPAIWKLFVRMLWTGAAGHPYTPSLQGQRAFAVCQPLRKSLSEAVLLLPTAVKTTYI